MKKIVVIGGGSGIFNVLVGLKKYDVHITAVVSMADSGGSTGILRNEFGILPPGDIRKCLVALSDSTNLVKEMFQYRFSEGEGLKGHSFGNLFLTVLKKVTGSEEKAILEAADILKIRGQVLPVTLDDSQLCVELEDGQTIRGESNVDVPKHNPKLRITNAFLEPLSHAYYGAVRAIEEADVIVIGPGDLYSSIIPNLVVKGIPEAIAASSAKKVYVCNLMTKLGETHGFTAKDFFDVVEQYVGKGVIGTIVVNDNNIPEELVKRYVKEGAEPVRGSDLLPPAVTVVKEQLISKHANVLRHHSDRIARTIINL